jgi:hypothetical protein
VKMIFAAASFASLLVFLFRSGATWSKTHQEDSDFHPRLDLNPKYSHTLSDGGS